MKRIAFVFRSAPHGSNSGREGLNALLATSNYTEEIAAFLCLTGYFSYYRNRHRQKSSPVIISPPSKSCRCTILMSATAVRRIWPHAVILETPYILPVTCLSAAELARKLAVFDAVVSF